MSDKKNSAKQPNPPPNLPNVYDVNPMMMEALHAVTPYNLPIFLMSNPEFVSSSDLIDFKKLISNLTKYLFGGLITGIAINVQIKRVYPGIITLPIYARLPIRLALLGLPFMLINHLVVKEMDKLNNLNFKYFVRIIKFRKTSDMAYMFPQ
jgi:hypothetical protein